VGAINEMTKWVLVLCLFVLVGCTGRSFRDIERGIAKDKKTSR